MGEVQLVSYIYFSFNVIAFHKRSLPGGSSCYFTTIWSEGLLLIWSRVVVVASPVVGEGAEEEDKALRYGDAEMDGKKDHNEEEDRVRPTLDATTVNLLQSSLAVGAILTLAFD